MACSTICNLRPFIRWQDLLPDVNDWVGSKIIYCFAYEYFFIVVASRIIFKIYVLIATSSTWLFSFFHNILVFVLLSMLVDISSCTCAHSFGIVAQIKLMGNLRWYVKSMVWYFSSFVFRKVHNCVMKEERVRRTYRFSCLFENLFCNC
jgi:hypothetical protein